MIGRGFSIRPDKLQKGARRYTARGDMSTEINNIAHFCGTVRGEAQYSHSIFSERFYSFMLGVIRLSGQEDILPVIVSERLLLDVEITDGVRVCVDGQLRSYNMMTQGRSRLVLQVFAKEICFAEEGLPDENSVYLRGYICKTPIYRVTPFSREIADVLLAVNRAYGKSDYIPCICWGRNARYCRDLEISQFMSINGRLQSREYQKRIDAETVETRIAYEVSTAKLCLEQEESEYFV